MDFKPIEFKAVQYTPQIADSKLLAQSLERQEARENKANAGLAGLDESLNKIRQGLNVEEQAAFDLRANEIRNSIAAEIDAGNYQSAIRFAQQQGRELAADSTLLDKIETNRQREEIWKKIDNDSSLSSITKQRWLEENPYVFNGRGEWKPISMPTKHFSFTDIQRFAEGITAEDSWSTGNTINNTRQILYDANGNLTNAENAKYIGESITANRSSSFSVHQKTKEDIRKTFNDLLNNNDIRASLLQDFKDYTWAYNKAINSNNVDDIEHYKNLLYDKKGIRITDFNKWLEEKVIPMFENMEYRRTTQESGRTDSVDYSGRVTALNPGKTAKQYGVPNVPQAQGMPFVQQGSGNGTPTNASNYSGLF